MFDLNEKRNLYELKWFDDTVLHCRMPSQSFLLRLAQIEEEMEGMNTGEMFNVLREIVGRIINNNIEKKTITDKELEDEMTIEVMQCLIDDYFNSVTNNLGE